ncbi:hypothetical protein [Methanobrevibacter sp.]|uniref:hypothetical protein n=1 Tax=Methanobrevibacter sp. TaxID=66852 RepID=UPI00397623A5
MDLLKTMKPILKFNAVVVSLSTLIMFGIWNLILLIPTQYTVIKYISVVISFVTSFGCYQLLVQVFDFFFDHVPFFRRFILGPYNLEGVWVGFSMGTQNDVRFYYEKFSQELDEIYINGQSFTDNGGYHGSWFVRNPMIDIDAGEMTYCFEADSIKNTFSNPGFGKFSFIRKDKQSAPTALRGYTSYVYNTNKLFGYEVKLSKGDFSDAELYEEAQKVYEKYKNIVQ